MDIREILNKERLYSDGGFGTLLQARGLEPGEKPENWNITHPDDITAIHLEYLNAGSDIISTNTFGANPLKFDNLEQIISAAFFNAKKAVELSGKEKAFIAFDMGPTGKLLEPLGDLSFEKAVEVFAETVKIAEKYSPDLYIVETMNDSYETKAAVLAVKENSDRAVFVSNVYDESRKLMTGASPKAMIALLEGLGADAIGINCSLGPRQMVDIVREYVKYSSLPVMVCPNAGLPRSTDGKTVFDVDSDEFSDCMAEIAEIGAAILGGCCGTTPAYIRKTVAKTEKIPFTPVKKKEYTFVSSYTHAVEIGKVPVLIGERINPTGKPKFKQALREGNISYIINEGVMQEEKGVDILDVNVGLPEIDEETMLVKCIKELQTVSALPLQIDTVKPSAMEKAMRVYNGKPLINSVNGKQESMDAVLPLVKKYGGTVIALTIDEQGIPDTAEGRAAIAEKIINECSKYGIDKKDVIVDPLAMTVSSDNLSGKITLDSVKMIKEQLGVKTSLGVSNISFGLPSRETVNSHFLTMAFALGLDCAIMNPYSVAMMESYYSFRALSGLDENCTDYIGFASSLKREAVTVASSASHSESEDMTPLVRAIVKGMKEDALLRAKELLKKEEPLTVINEYIVPALDKVGRHFEAKTMYLPQLLMSAEAASRAFDAVKELVSASEESKGKIIVATVKGDIHDIGKNIVKVLLENYGYDVIDLGKDVPPEVIVNKAKEEKVSLVGLSALMTTTTDAMKETVALLKKECPDTVTVVGGAVLTKEYADMIGADYYAKDAMETVRFAESFFGGEG
ncbi:MAG: homocysteine S-methyltransferase family protein [Clostridia bacterium]|nr:homocysteine S-methyltransferase family protein [Clostridia bacterium]